MNGSSPQDPSDGRPPLGCAVVHHPALVLLRRLAPPPPDVPCVAVDRDGPTGRVLDACPRARRAGIRPGLRLAAARAAHPHLHVTPVPPKALADLAIEVLRALARISPFVQPLLHPDRLAAPPHDGHVTPTDLTAASTFFFDATGLSKLFGPPEEVAHQAQRALAERGLSASVALGFHRLRLSALTRTRAQVRVFPHPADEERAARRLPITRLPLPPQVAERLQRLGVHTVEDLASLPEADLRERFGNGAALLHERTRLDALLPSAPVVLPEPIRFECGIDPPDDHVERLAFACKHLVDRACRTARSRLAAVASIDVLFILDRPPDDAACHDERARLTLQVAPARPTCEAAVLSDLLRLRLAHTPLPGRVTCVRLTPRIVPEEVGQLPLLADATRDSEAARAALARVRAMFGPAAVGRPIPRADHLPERQHQFHPTLDFRRPRPTVPDGPPPLVRRILPHPQPVSVDTRTDTDGVRPRPSPPAVAPPRPASARRPVRLCGRRLCHAFGPFRVSGVWWTATVTRDYFYVQTRDGALAWIFFDHGAGQWFLHGWID